jgi:hypothetical protein
MDDTPRSAPASDLLAIAVAMLSFSGLNAIWTLFDLDNRSPIPFAILVALLAGTGVAMALIAWKLREGRLTPETVGVGLDGWRADRRLLALFLSVIMAYNFYLPPEDPALTAAVVPRPTWGDYCFWFVIISPVSLAEVLVFLILPVALLERWLTDRGQGRLAVRVAVIAVSAVSFGLFHYSYPQLWHKYVFLNMLEMAFVAVYFLQSRNFHLSLLMHNAIAATGFSTAQYAPEGEALKQSTFTPELGYILTAFLLPYLLIHVWEWSVQRRQKPAEPAKPPSNR